MHKGLALSFLSFLAPTHWPKEEQELSPEPSGIPFLIRPQDPRRSYRRPSYLTLLLPVVLVGMRFTPVFPSC